MGIITCLIKLKDKSNTGLTFNVTTLRPEPPDFIRFVNRLTGHRLRGMSFSARSHACDRRKRSPPFLLSDDCSTLSQIASRTPLSNQRSSLSKTTTSSGLKMWPEFLHLTHQISANTEIVQSRTRHFHTGYGELYCGSMKHKVIFH